MLLNKLTQLTIIIVSSILFTVSVSAATFTVDSTGDEADLSAGNGICATSLGTCTLRAAIQEANALAGADNIHFNIPTSDPGYRDYDNPDTPSSGDSTGGDDYWTIRNATALPSISETVSINGNTQELSSGSNRNLNGPDIEIRNTSAFPGSLFVFLSGATSSEIRGLVLNNFGTSSINAGINSFATGLLVAAMYIGTDIKGLADAVGTTSAGVYINGNLGNMIGNQLSDRNIMSGLSLGVTISNCTGDIITANSVKGNFIGIGSDGTTVVSNTSYGIYSGPNCRVEIGGPNLVDRNIISGNSTGGINFQGLINTNEEVQIYNNYFGTDVSGTLSRPNGGSGDIRTQSGDNSATSNRHRIGAPGKGNLFRFNARSIWLNNSGLDYKMTIEHNTFSDGTAFRSILVDGAGNNTIIQNNAIGGFESDPYFGLETNPNPFRGIEIRTGGSPIIRGNIINGGTSNGIYVFSGNLDTRTSGTTDVIGRPVIGGQNTLTGSLCNGLEQNCIYDYAWSGIYSVETIASNESTLWADNDFTGGNGADTTGDGIGDRNIEQVWYGLFEIHSSNYRRTDLTGTVLNFPSGTKVRTTDDPSTEVTSATAINVTCLGTSGVSCPATGHTTGTLDNTYIAVPSGQTGTVLNNVNNWFRITEYIYDGTGNKINYSSFKFDQPHFSSRLFTFDGNSTNNVINTGSARTIDSQNYTDRGEPWTDRPGATRNISTGDIGRFQIMEVEFVDANPVWQPSRGGYVITIDSGEDTLVSFPTYSDDGGFNNTNAAASGGMSKRTSTDLADGKTTFREAISLANSFAARELIDFSIPTSDPTWNTPEFPNRFNLTFDGALPTLTSSVILDGRTQEQFTGDNHPMNYNINAPEGITNGPEVILNFDNTIPRWDINAGTPYIIKMGFYNSAPNQRLVGFTNAEGVMLESDFVNGNFGSLFVLNHANCQVEIYRNVFKNSLNQPTIEEACARGGLQKLIGNYFINSQSGAVAFVNTTLTGVARSAVSGNFFSGDGNIGIYANPYRNIFIENNIFRGMNRPGILVTDYQTSKNVLARKNIFDMSNSSIPIDLSLQDWVGDGVTINDTGDIDTGPNSLQNYPVIQNVKFLGNGDYQVSGTVDGEDSLAPFMVEICESHNNDSGNGVCKNSLGLIQTQEQDGVHRWERIVNISGSNGEDNRFFTSLATNKNYETSEFGEIFVANSENSNYERLAYTINLDSPSSSFTTPNNTPLLDWSTEFNGQSIVEYPKLLASVSTGGGFSYDIERKDNYIYVAHYGFISIVDVSDPNKPKIIGTYTGFTGGANSRQLEVSSNLLVGTAGTWGSVISIANITNPSQPSPLYFGTPGGVQSYDAEVNGDYLYLKSNQGLTVVNITNPSSPVHIKNVTTTPGASFVDSFVRVDNILYMTTNEYIQIYDITNPADPVPNGSVFIGTSSTIQRDGNRLYVSKVGNNGLLTYDITNRTSPALISEFIYDAANANALTDIEVFGSIIFLSKVGLGIYVIDISNINSPSIIKNIRTETTIYNSGLEYYNGILFSGNYDLNPPVDGIGALYTFDLGTDLPNSLIEQRDDSLSGYEIILNGTTYQTLSNELSQFQVTEPLQPGNYKWQVKALWQDGSVAGISEEKSFRVPPSPLQVDLSGSDDIPVSSPISTPVSEDDSIFETQDLESDEDIAGTIQGETIRNILIVGGITGASGVGVYWLLLLLKKRRSTKGG